MSETLANLESFARSAEAGSFSAAARRLGLTPAAVSRNVATLERNLGIRLFQRSTRSLSLTEAGERFLAEIGGSLDHLQAAIAAAGTESEPAGSLRVSLSPTFGAEYIVPLLPDFLARYPRVRIDWQFDNRAVDLITENFDAAIGGGFDLSAGLVARPLAPAHIIAVASPDYMRGRRAPADPSGLSSFDGIVLRSARTGRLRRWTMRDVGGAEMAENLSERMSFNDPAAMREAALLGLGVAMLAVADVRRRLDDKTLVRLLPGWYADAGAISLYYANRTLVPGKTRAFIDFVLEAFKQNGYAKRFAGSLG